MPKFSSWPLATPPPRAYLRRPDNGVVVETGIETLAIVVEEYLGDKGGR